MSIKYQEFIDISNAFLINVCVTSAPSQTQSRGLSFPAASAKMWKVWKIVACVSPLQSHQASWTRPPPLSPIVLVLLVQKCTMDTQPVVRDSSCILPWSSQVMRQGWQGWGPVLLWSPPGAEFSNIVPRRKRPASSCSGYPWEPLSSQICLGVPYTCSGWIEPALKAVFSRRLSDEILT